MGAAAPVIVLTVAVSHFLLTVQQVISGTIAVLVITGILTISMKSPTPLDRSFRWRWPLSTWLAASLTTTIGVTVLIYVRYGYSPKATVYAAVMACSGTYAMMAIIAAYSEADLFDRRTVPLWLVVGAVVGTSAAVVVYVRSRSLIELGVLGAVIYGGIFLLVIVPLSLYDRKRDPPPIDGCAPSMSVIIPAFNEEGYIGRCLEHVLAAEYPESHLEVIVVDDGSTDATYQEAASFRSEGVSVFRRRNGGKHAALNFGFACSTGDIVVTIDADSLITQGALKRIAAAFEADPTIGAVAGHVKVVNRNGFLTRLQSLEYILSVCTLRRAFGFMGAVPVVPGCLGGFRREALEAVDAYDPDTITEDFDATIKVLKEGYSIRQIDAVVWTEAPFTWGDLYRQRCRWYQGNVETMLKHFDVFTHDSSRLLHRFVFPFRLVSSVIIPVITAILVVSAPFWLAGRSVLEVGISVTVFLTLVFSVSHLVLRIEDESYGHVLFVPFLALVYRMFITATICVGIGNALMERNTGWRKVDRAEQRSGDGTH